MSKATPSEEAAGSGGGSLPRADLSAAFAPQKRAAGLRLPAKKAPRARKTPQSAPSEAASGPAAAEEPQEAQTPEKTSESRSEGLAGPRRATTKVSGPAKRSAAREGRTAGPQKPQGGASASKPLVVWSPVSIRDRMRQHRAATGARQLDQVLDAVEATVDDLPDLVAAAGIKPGPKRGQTVAAPAGGLFERTSTAEAGAGEAHVQLLIRGAIASHFEVLDQLVEQTGANSRSALIVCALDSYLPR